MKITLNDFEIEINNENANKIFDESKLIITNLLDKMGKDGLSSNDILARVICMNTVLNTSLSNSLYSTGLNDDEIVNLIIGLYK